VRIRRVVTAGACTTGPIGWRTRLLMPSPVPLVGQEPLVPHPSGPAWRRRSSAIAQLADGHRLCARPPPPRLDPETSSQPALTLAGAVTPGRSDLSQKERPACASRWAPSRSITQSLTPPVLLGGLCHVHSITAVSPDGRLYLGSGATGNVCAEPNPESAAILSFNPDGTGPQVSASGLRNPYGLAFQPGTGRLYADVNGQDNLGNAGDPEPADMVVNVEHLANYGWPRCWPVYARGSAHRPPTCRPMGPRPG